VPFFTRKPLLETVKGFLRLDICLYFPVQAIAYLPYFPDWRCPRASTVPIQATPYCSFPKRLWLAGYSWIV
jgi:hypothetical protein